MGSSCELYVTNERSLVSRSKHYPANCHWKSDNDGLNSIEIHPTDPLYTPGTYTIGVFSANRAKCEFCISVDTLTVAEVRSVEDEVRSEIEEWGYFRYRAKSPGNSRVKFVLQHSAAAQCEMFVSMTALYPSAEHCNWRPPNSQSSEPVFLDPYTEMPKHYEKPASRWTKHSSPEVVCSYPQTANALTLCIDSSLSEGGKSDYYIAIRNPSKCTVAVKLTVIERLLESLLPAEEQNLLSFYRESTSDIESSAISLNDRERLSLPHYGQFTYGEVDFASMIQLLRLCEIRAGEVFWDLGCGAGKCVFAAAILRPELKAAKGVELLPGLCQAARQLMERLRGVKACNAEIVEGDLMEVDWAEADIIYISSLCFPSDLLLRISQSVLALKSGARVLTLTAFLSFPPFTLQRHIRVSMSWGVASVYLYQKQ